MSFFKEFKQAASDPIFGLNALLKADKRAEKIDLLIGYYKDEANEVPIFRAVKKAQELLFKKEKDLNYFPIDGYGPFITGLKNLIFDPSHQALVYGAQTVGGTSALHHLGRLLAFKGRIKIAIPDPTWANHKQVFEYLGLEVVSYPYYNALSHTLLWDELLASLNALPSGSAVLLHVSCHNPSGSDFSLEQWVEIAKVCKKSHLIPFFDCAYQGLGNGLVEDIQSIQVFCNHVDEFFLAYSCSKNFGLYGERTGACFFYSKTKAMQDIVASHIKQSIRATYSNPPRHGALIVSEILHSKELTQEWKQELNSYKERIHHYRKKYKLALEKLTGKDFSYVVEGKGLFVFTGLTPSQVTHLQEKHAIYLASDGRVNLTGLNEKNFDRVTEALATYL